jgi:hypothetical protein
MASSSLESKTVRPGRLGAYSYYHSARRPDHRPRPRPGYIAAPRTRLVPWKLVVAVLLIAAAAVIPFLNGGGAPAADKSQASQASSAPEPQSSASAVAAPDNKPDECAGNSLKKKVLVDISRRHMWACSGGKTVYDSPVITGIAKYPATLTPPGTYHVYDKQRDTVLTGRDITGSWSDPVSYWMPFLSNQYGVYGFHDATWRSNDEFGKVSPASSDASHGCVELPLATSAWLYKWAPVGTTVTIKS